MYLVPNWDDWVIQRNWLIITAIDIFILENIERKKKIYVRGQCLNKTTFAAFGGKHRRNVFTGLETRIYGYFLILSMFLFHFFPNITFQSCVSLFWNCLVCLYIPIRHIRISRDALPEMFEKVEEMKTYKFYVHKQEKLTPRPNCENEKPSESFPGRQHKRKRSYINNKKNMKRYKYNKVVPDNQLHNILEMNAEDEPIIQNNLVKKTDYDIYPVNFVNVHQHQNVLPEID